MNVIATVSQLKSMFGKVTSMSTDHAEKLLDLLDRAPNEALEMLVAEKVKFCWMPAQRRLNDRKKSLVA